MFSLLNNDILTILIKNYIPIHFRKSPYSKILFSLDPRFSKIIKKCSHIKENYTFCEIKSFANQGSERMIDYIVRSNSIFFRGAREKNIPIFFNWFSSSLKSILKGAAKGGHLQMIKDLQKTQKMDKKFYDESILNNVIKNAAKSGHTDIIIWALKKVCKRQKLKYIKSDNELENLKILLKASKNNEWILMCSLNYGNFEYFKFILSLMPYKLSFEEQVEKIFDKCRMHLSLTKTARTISLVIGMSKELGYANLEKSFSEKLNRLDKSGRISIDNTKPIDIQQLRVAIELKNNEMILYCLKNLNITDVKGDNIYVKFCLNDLGIIGDKKLIDFALATFGKFYKNISLLYVKCMCGAAKNRNIKLIKYLKKKGKLYWENIFLIALEECCSSLHDGFSILIQYFLDKGFDDWEAARKSAKKSTHYTHYYYFTKLRDGSMMDFDDVKVDADHVDDNGYSWHNGGSDDLTCE